jgi:hypothetical protein
METVAPGRWGVSFTDKGTLSIRARSRREPISLVTAKVIKQAQRQLQDRHGHGNLPGSVNADAVCYRCRGDSEYDMQRCSADGCTLHVHTLCTGHVPPRCLCPTMRRRRIWASLSLPHCGGVRDMLYKVISMSVWRHFAGAPSRVIRRMAFPQDATRAAYLSGLSYARGCSAWRRRSAGHDSAAVAEWHECTQQCLLEALARAGVDPDDI